MLAKNIQFFAKNNIIKYIYLISINFENCYLFIFLILNICLKTNTGILI
jgi:hypothetical protein